jgi:hypothetical protein
MVSHSGIAVDWSCHCRLRDVPIISSSVVQDPTVNLTMLLIALSVVLQSCSFNNILANEAMA